MVSLRTDDDYDEPIDLSTTASLDAIAHGAAKEIEVYAQRLALVESRLGTPLERPGDLDDSVNIAHWMRNRMVVLLLTQDLRAG